MSDGVSFGAIKITMPGLCALLTVYDAWAFLVKTFTHMLYDNDLRLIINIRFYKILVPWSLIACMLIARFLVACCVDRACADLNVWSH